MLFIITPTCLVCVFVWSNWAACVHSAGHTACCEIRSVAMCTAQQAPELYPVPSTSAQHHSPVLCGVKMRWLRSSNGVIHLWQDGHIDCGPCLSWCLFVNLLSVSLESRLKSNCISIDRRWNVCYCYSASVSGILYIQMRTATRVFYQGGGRVQYVGRSSCKVS